MDKTDSSQLHAPVLLNEVVEHFPHLEKETLLGMDGTFGRRGHTKVLLEKYTNLKMIGLDQDEQAILYAKSQYEDFIREKKLILDHVNFEHAEESFRRIKSEHGYDKLDFILLDLGVSSPQLDVADRGFSFYQDGPLDMRMDQTSDLTAQYLLENSSEEELIEIFKTFGEVRSPYRVVRAIVHDRKEKSFNSTVELAEMIARIDRWRKKGHHPATKYFMALRLKVNDELGVVERVLPKMIQMLSNGGRIMVITFHSLEDRIVKRIFKANLDYGRLVNKKVITASKEEQAENSRARSAKLRIFEKVTDEKESESEV